MKLISLAFQKITGWIDSINDRLTSYRLVLYFLLVLIGWAILGSLLNQVSYNWYEILWSAVWLSAICWAANKAISKFLDIPANKESDLISALILSLILTPAKSAEDFAVLAGAGVAAMASKYIITLSRSHIFNPAAVGAFIAGEVFHKYPAWWVGTKFMTPMVALGAVLVLRKTKRFSLALVFLATLILYLIYGTSTGSNLHFLWLELISTQALFFAVVMLTEPLTSPTLASRFLPYGVLVGICYSVTKLKLSPEEALLVGNLFTFLVARNQRYQLKFIRRIKEAEGIYSYVFSIPKNFKFKAGQYMEWTIAQNKSDSRGNRRYLTIASSPTEPGVMFTIKHPAKASAFKQRLDQLKPGDPILASHLAGSFTLPADSAKPLALLAGGIGVTPFRSMVKQLIDSGQQRDVALVYSAATEAELSYRNLFAQAQTAGVRANYVTGSQLDEAKLKALVPDYAKRTFYISGPLGFVKAEQANLTRLGVSSTNIITDYFPGYG